MLKKEKAYLTNCSITIRNDFKLNFVNFVLINTPDNS